MASHGNRPAMPLHRPRLTVHSLGHKPLVLRVNRATTEDSILQEFVLLLLQDQSNESYFLFNNIFMMCLKTLMTRDLCLYFYFVNTIE